jgi:hypothetical protein
LLGFRGWGRKLRHDRARQLDLAILQFFSSVLQETKTRTRSPPYAALAT